MVLHRDQAKFDRAQWRLMVLVPSWMVQISLYLVLIGISAYLLANAIGVSDETNGTAIAWESITIGFAAISILCTAFEIFRTFAEALTPKEMVVSSLVKLVGIIVSMIMGGLMSDTDLSSWITGTQVVHGLLIIPVLALGSYAAWIWRCLAQYDDYGHPANVKPFGFKSDRKDKLSHSRNESDDWDVELRASWASREVAMGNAVDITSPPPTSPSPEDAPAKTRERGSSFVRVGGRLNFSLTNDVDATNEHASRSRANSSSALMGSTSTIFESIPLNMSTPDLVIPKRPASYISVTGTGLDRRASYNHTRDTAFDEYVKQHRSRQQNMSQSSIASSSGGGRSSSAPLARVRALSNTDRTAAQQQKLKNDVDDAMGTAFGWGTASRSSSLDSVMAGGTPPAIAVGGGAVPNAKSVRNSLGRAPSDGSERGAVDSVPENGDNNDSRDGDVDEETRQKNVDEASRALLGGQQEEDDYIHPESLRPGSARPRALSETIEFIVTPPPRTPTEEKDGGVRKTWGAAYQL
ncbi:hypothetical protein J7T55_010792 [Diaporthe amygdali]|uniref:uncharacterized protein n=1 Tax=Phomopsis amygdali TaxID=1214568 RepID=UPI0022FE6ECA|nr:uncharacterized protein J7T55_010792 [Diaporthe amygdali]KAJ0114403.1 hypothetical protein J7T55_010792 [Diaporthe amygdali]